MKDSMTLPRRHVLAGSAAALSALGLAGWAGSARAQASAPAKPLPAYALALGCDGQLYADTLTKVPSSTRLVV